MGCPAPSPLLVVNWLGYAHPVLKVGAQQLQRGPQISSHSPCCRARAWEERRPEAPETTGWGQKPLALTRLGPRAPAPLPYPGPPQAVASCSAHPGPRGLLWAPAPPRCCRPSRMGSGACSELVPSTAAQPGTLGHSCPFCRGQRAGTGRGVGRAGAGPRREAVVSGGTSSLLARGACPGARRGAAPDPGSPRSGVGLRGDDTRAAPEVGAGSRHGTLTRGASSRRWPTSPHNPTENPACTSEGGLSTRRRRRPREASPRSPASVRGSPASSGGHGPEG